MVRITTSTVTANAGNLLASYPGGTFAVRVLVSTTVTFPHGSTQVNQNAAVTAAVEQIVAVLIRSLTPAAGRRGRRRRCRRTRRHQAPASRPSRPQERGVGRPRASAGRRKDAARRRGRPPASPAPACRFR